MSKSDAGKGDSPRPIDRKKWESWWDQYDKAKCVHIVDTECDLGPAVGIYCDYDTCIHYKKRGDGDEKER